MGQGDAQKVRKDTASGFEGIRVEGGHFGSGQLEETFTEGRFAGVGVADKGNVANVAAEEGEPVERRNVVEDILSWRQYRKKQRAAQARNVRWILFNRSLPSRLGGGFAGSGHGCRDMVLSSQ